MNLTHTAVRGGRLSQVLRRELHISTGLMNRLKWSEGLLVNGAPVHTDYPVQPGDVLTLRLEEETPQYPAQDGPLEILYEDDFILAVDKPVGTLIHPSRAKNEDTLANYVAGYYARTGQCCAFHPLTRLDRDTFGVVLLAKNSYIHARLQESRPQKTYQALVYGAPEQDAGLIDAPIARKELPSLLREIRPDGKPSRTRYQVLHRGTPVSRLALTPVTGRTHQLRLHCAYMGFPILGDPQYGSSASLAYSDFLGVHTQMLWAWQLTFLHPVTGEEITLRSRQDGVFKAAAP